MQSNDGEKARRIARTRVFVVILSLLLPNAIAADTKTIVRANLTNIVMLIALDSEGQPKAIGSGFFVGENGEIASNFHVIEDAASAVVKLIGSDRRFQVQEMLRADAEADLVVLKVNTKSVPVRFGRDEALEVGDRLVAIGNPEGLEGTVSEGIVSGFRKLSETNKLIQITAPISPGSSGGPVFNAAGEVVGVASSTLAEGQNLNFAIPSSKLNELLRKPPLNLALPEARKVMGGRKRFDGFRDTSELVHVVDYRCLNNGVKFSVFNGTDKPISNVRLIAKFYRTQWSNPLQAASGLDSFRRTLARSKLRTPSHQNSPRALRSMTGRLGFNGKLSFRFLTLRCSRRQRRLSSSERNENGALFAGCEQLNMASNEIFARVRRATVGLVLFHPNVRQKPYTIVGSGFCVDPNGVVVTCQHVVSAFMEKPVPDQMAQLNPAERKSKLHHKDDVKMQIPFVVFLVPGDVPHQIKALPCRVDQIMARTDFDLAIVRVLPHKALPAGYPFLEIEPYEDISEGDEVATCGYPLGNFLFEQIGTITSSFTRGSISSIVPSQGIPQAHLKMFQLNLTATYGNSGGPVFAVKTGRAFGVLQGGIIDRQGKILPGLSRAEPIYPVVNANDINLIKSAAPGQLPHAEQFKKAWGVPG